MAAVAALSDRVDHPSFRTPTVLPVLGALSCVFMAGPWTGRDPVQYEIAGVLLGVGVALWVVTALIDRATGLRSADSDLEGAGTPPAPRPSDRG